MDTRPSTKPLPTLTRLAVSTLLLGAFCWPQLSEAKGKRVITSIPDFTQPDSPKPVDKQPYNALGTTGAFGWIYNDDGYNSDGVTQVFIGEVEANTPAAGKLQKGDVILGASPGTTAKPFTLNARHEMAAALTQAELESNSGHLALKVWRDGKTSEVQLTIPVVKGAYDVNSPLTSPKLQTEIDLLASAIAKRGLKGGDWKEGFDALGLLATGDKQYWPMLKTFANSLAVTKELDLNSRQKTAWGWGYCSLFLAEYYGATGDKSVLPDLEKYATALAKGQGYAGTWNHCVANPDMHGNDGQLHGRLGGYGAINQTTSACAIALAIAKKVGVDNQEISDAIQRSAEHFEFFVDKGSIPYGDHSPGMNHAANGKNASTAVFLDLIGEDNRYERYGACTGLRYAGRGSAKAVDALIEKALKSKDLTMQYYACEAFALPRKWNSRPFSPRSSKRPRCGLPVA